MPKVSDTKKRDAEATKKRILTSAKKAFAKKGIQTCIRTPELEENEAIRKIWENFKPVTHKRRRTYKKLMSS